MEIALGPLRQVVVQPTPFCNLDCRYCYLPNRSDPSVMDFRTLEQVAAAVTEFPFLDNRVEFRWHAGEPLVVGRDFYLRAFAAVQAVMPSGVQAEHSLQTNGTLIDRAWCDFFGEYGVRVGVSVDGPAEVHDRHRLNRQGKKTFHATQRGLCLLREAGVPFDIITVLTRDSIGDPHAMYEFWASLGAREVGLNIDETEGTHRSSFSRGDGGLADYVEFLDLINRLHRDGRVRIRELAAINGLIWSGSNTLRSPMNVPFAIAAIDWKGDVTSFSPEFLGLSSERYGDFVLGNVWRNSLLEMASREPCRRLQEAIEAGVALCRGECPYFSLCGGGAPINKLFENGAFESTETAYCVARVKIPAQILLSEWERGL